MPGTANPLFAGSIPARASIPLFTTIPIKIKGFLAQSDNRNDNKYYNI